MPQLGASGVRRSFRLADCLPSSWEASARLRRVGKIATELPFERVAPTALVGGPGFIVLPHDPVRAVGILPHVRRLVKALDGQAMLACTPQVFPWIHGFSADDILICETSGEELDGWCRETAGKRRAWAWSLDEQPDADTIVALFWLGGERRIAPDRQEYARIANIRMPIPAQGDVSLEAIRCSEAQRLGLTLPPYDYPVHSPGGSVVLEIPTAIRRGDIRRWVDLATALSARYPLIVVHFDFLPPEMGESLRVLGNRLSLLRISRSDDVFRLGSEVRTWIAQVGPASVIASQAGCAPIFLDADRSPPMDLGPEAARAANDKHFLGSRNPAPSEVVDAVLDLAGYGM